MKYKVRIAARARIEIAENYTWMAQQSLASANRWIKRIHEAIASLESNPHRYPEAPEAVELERDIKQMIVGPKRHAFRILFVIIADTVTVQRARHRKRNSLGTGEY